MFYALVLIPLIYNSRVELIRVHLQETAA